MVTKSTPQYPSPYYSTVEVFAPRCSNPEPEEPGNTVATADSSISGSGAPSAPADAGYRQTPAQLVVPKVVRVTPVYPKAVQVNAIMTGEEAKRRKEAQVEFPRATHMQSAQQPHNSNSHNGGSRGQRALHAPHHQPQQQHNNMTESPAISQASYSTKGKKTPSGGVNSHSSLGGGSLNSDVVSSLNIHPTPLFQRLVSEEVQELKAYARIIETQNRRLAELERVHGDLEVRLELQSNRRMELEQTLEERERSWAEKIAALEKERDQMQHLVKLERTKNEKLREQALRKDQDIQRMLQRKYDHQRNDGQASSIRNTRGPSKSPMLATGESPKTSSADLKLHNHKSPHFILNANGPTEAVREREVVDTLKNFFGLG